MTAVLLIGFGYEAPDYFVHPKLARPAIMWVHAAAMTAWIAVYIAQTALVRADNVRAHRRLGQGAQILALAMVPLMLAAAWVIDRFDLIHFPLPDRAAQIAFLTAQLWGAASFATFIGLGAAWRKRREYHSRLMFLGTCILLDAGFGRFPVPWGPAGTELPEHWAYLAVDSLIVVAMIRDRLTLDRVHQVYRVALPLLLCGQALIVYLIDIHPHWWVATASKLLGLDQISGR